MTRLVVAVGGNALAADGGFDAQRRTVRETAEDLAAAAGDADLAVTHGNGPQVGHRLLEAAAADTPAKPLDVLVAETQASIGGLLTRELDARLGRPTAGLLTRAVVDPDDSAFEDPTKPVGPRYTEAEADERAFETRAVGEGDRPYRRVVPSPEPLSVPEADAVDGLLSAGQAVVCGGGGGIPVTPDGGGVEAVVDKDHTTRILAAATDADRLVFLTDVPYAFLGYGTDDQRPIERATPAEIREHLADGAFGEGSMAPKMRACARFAGAGGEAIVGNLDDPAAVLAGEAGTVVRTAGCSSADNAP